MDSNTEKYFPSDYDEYYYYCRISIVEEAKEKYIQCNRLLLGTEANSSPVMKLLVDKTDEKKKAIYSKYERLYQNFITYSDKLITKDDVDSEETYKRYMENLMRISNETIVFTYENFGMQKSGLLRQKLEYNGQKRKLSYIIGLNRNIPYILNPDEVMTALTNKYGNSYIYFAIFAMLFIGLVCVPLIGLSIYSKLCILGYHKLNVCNMVVCLVISILSIIASLLLLISRIKHRKNLYLMEIKGNVNSKNYYLVLHPYTSKFSLKSLKEIAGIIKSFIK